jgi:hypothetical protein
MSGGGGVLCGGGVGASRLSLVQSVAEREGSRSHFRDQRWP